MPKNISDLAEKKAISKPDFSERHKTAERKKLAGKKFAGGRPITDEELAKRRELLKAQARELWEKKLSQAEIKTYRE